ncbi:MAG: hypothetical protein LBD08_05185 [Treponema sp.]|jgi:diacylglycerol kinase family enzyme|nr:hypothetical protein [Treponema sp.]
MKHLFVVNPRSFRYNPGSMQHIISRIHQCFSGAESEDYFVHISQFPRDAVGLIRSFAGAARKETAVRVYAVGGDGILFDCLNGIMGFKNTELAAVPCGRTNSFVQSFGKHNAARFRDLRLQISSPAVPIDVMKAGSNYALNFCLAGTESLALRYACGFHEAMDANGRMGRWLARLLYEAAYIASGLAACANAALLRQYYTISVDGEDLSGRYRGLNIANGGCYAGKLHPVTGARPDDGVLHILFAQGGSVPGTLGLLPFYLWKRHTGASRRELFIKKARTISIRSETPILIGLDDIVFYETSLTVELLPGALRFVDVSAPRGAGGAQ